MKVDIRSGRHGAHRRRPPAPRPVAAARRRAGGARTARGVQHQARRAGGPRPRRRGGAGLHDELLRRRGDVDGVRVCPRRGSMNRDAAAAATWIFCGDESRPRRGPNVDIPWGSFRTRPDTSGTKKTTSTRAASSGPRTRTRPGRRRSTSPRGTRSTRSRGATRASSIRRKSWARRASSTCRRRARPRPRSSTTSTRGRAEILPNGSRRRGRELDISRRRVAAPPRMPRGYFVGSGDARGRC